MAAIVFQYDKRSGLTYAYESISYWDKEKKQSRARRTLVGRVDKDTGEIVPTDGRGRKKKNNDNSNAFCKDVSRSFCGATYLFDAIGNKLGIIDDLKRCFPENYKQILSIAYYLILEESESTLSF